MADTIKNLGQVMPAAATLTVLVTATGNGATLSSVWACNQSSTQSAKIRISNPIAGAADAPLQYLVFDLTLQPNESRAFVAGVTMAATDLLRVQSDTGNVSFNAYGVAL
jgi:hypothetical protein